MNATTANVSNTSRQEAVYVRPDTKMFLGMLEQMGGLKLSEMTAADARASYQAMRFVADVDPTPLAVIKDISIPGPAGDLTLRYYDALESRAAGPVIVFFHGGGFVIGDLETHHPFCTEMAAQMDLPVLAVDYRLAPEHPFPAAPDDCEAATRWIAGNGAALGLDITGLILTGDSAGGNLAIVTAQALVEHPAAKPLLAIAPLYPVVDSRARYGSFEQFAEGFLLTADTMGWFDNGYAAPAGHPRRDCIHGQIVSLPRTLLVTAGLDPLRDQGRAFAAKAISEGVDVDYVEVGGTVHGFICLRKGIPSAQADCDRIFSRMKMLIQSA